MCKGYLDIIGIGPGDVNAMTKEAYERLEQADICVGYSKYISLLPKELRGKETIDTGMKKEVERCEMALSLAEEGKKVAIVSSGDAGIYAMAGLCYELAKKRNMEDFLTVYPGVSAAQAAAARLGAPLMHDTAYISLSDLLTPWEVIEKRILLAAEGDFVISFYNPRSKGREGHLEKAIALMLKYKSPDTPVGMVKNAYREQEEVKVETLRTLDTKWVDMFTVVIVGNRESYIWKEKMVTPRGYQL